ncbi:MAG: transcriptional repressor [Actinomycetota bacterium]
MDPGTGASRFDPNVADHHHLVCVDCGGVRDVRVAGAQQLTPDGGQQGFDAPHVIFRGHCSERADAAQRS